MSAFVALSCFQGRLQGWAFEALASLAPDGIQLTPGNLPTEGLAAAVARSGLPTRTHQGFDPAARRGPVWDGPRCVADSDSVHAPPLAVEGFWERLGRERPSPALEVMYPGHHLGCGRDVLRAMDARLPLAVDVSHVHLQLAAGVMTPAQWARLSDYDRIVEVHVSRDDGRHDVHQPIAPDTFGLAWARERSRDGLPVVLECYMHRMSRAEAADQLGLLTT